MSEHGRMNDDREHVATSAEWAKSRVGFLAECTAEEIEVVASITADHPGWVQQQKNEADPWVVAHAAVCERVIATGEARRGSNVPDAGLHIPDVADEWNVGCGDFNEMAREEGWRF